MEEQYSVRTLKPKRKRTISVYLTSSEKKELITECGDAALILYEHYIAKAGLRDYKYTDSKNAFALGWEPSKAKRIRLKLEKANYLKTIVYRNKQGNYTVTYIGKENVLERNHDDDELFEGKPPELDFYTNK